MDSNHRCPGVGQESSPLDHGTVNGRMRDETGRIKGCQVDSPGIAPESPVCRTGVFLLDHEPENISDFGFSISDCTTARLRRLKSEIQNPRSEIRCGGWNRTNALLVQSQALLPAATTPQCCCRTEIRDREKVRGGGFEPPSPGSKAGSLPLADPRECPAGVGPACPAWKAGAFAARPRARCSFAAEGEGVEPSRLIARRFSKPLPSPVGLPFRKAAVKESNLCLLLNREPPDHSATPQLMSWRLIPT